MTRPTVQSFHHAGTGTWSHVVADPVSGAAAIVDPVLDYDAASGRTATTSAAALVAHVRAQGLRVDWILETHAHADHLSAAPFVQDMLGGRIAIGAGIAGVQAHFKPLYGVEPEFATDGSQFGHLFADGERFALGTLGATVIPCPGHTPDSIAYLIGDALFTGDSLFMPDAGTARCDFPGGDAATLYRSIRRLFELPPETRVFVCHDYGPNGRPVACETTIAAQRRDNLHVRDGTTEAEFVALRQTRDATLSLPALIHPSVQVNLRAGRLPPPDANGIRHLRIPVDAGPGSKK
jgi:glyoxylase-like metal-dependent hydrolase (beta-lactamase superfamily II)